MADWFHKKFKHKEILVENHPKDSQGYLSELPIR